MNAVLINKTTGVIQKRGQYPRLDMQPIEGLDPSLEWLLEYKPFIEPDYDPRIFELLTIEEITSTPHPDYAHLNQFKITYITQKRSNFDIKKAISDVEANSNEAINPIDKRVKVLTLAVHILLRKVGGITLLPKEQVVMDLVTAMSAKIWKNDATTKAMHAQVDNNIEPDIDSAAWERNL